jgi:hypothetical protein
MTTNNNGLGPAGHEAGHVGADNGLTEDGTVQDVTDGSIGRFPHLLKLELLDTLLVWGDGSALDSDLVLLDGVGRLNSNLVISGITVLNGEIVVLKINVNIGSDVL